MKEAARRGTNPSRLPKKRFVSRSCGLHFAVEPATALRGRPCEQCEVIKAGLNGGGAYKPTYIHDGSNYLLKILSGDANFVSEVSALADFLGGEFQLKQNPLFLSQVSWSVVAGEGEGEVVLSTPPFLTRHLVSSRSLQAAKKILDGGGVLAPHTLSRMGTMHDSLMGGGGGLVCQPAGGGGGSVSSSLASGLPPFPPPTAPLPTPPAPGAPGGRLPPMNLGREGSEGEGGGQDGTWAGVDESGRTTPGLGGGSVEGSVTLSDGGGPETLGTLRKGSTVRFEDESQVDEVTSVNSGVQSTTMMGMTQRLRNASTGSAETEGGAEGPGEGVGVGGGEGTGGGSATPRSQEDETLPSVPASDETDSQTGDDLMSQTQMHEQ